MASLGQSLREERETRNISIEEIASATKIVPRYIEALEADRLDIMPGVFFIKGIIRTYARAIGLDPEGVLTKYRAAGLIAGAEHGRDAFPRPAPVPRPQIEPTPSIAPISPGEPVPPTEAAPLSVEKAVPDLVFEGAPKSGLSPAVRRRIFAWTWRTLAAFVILAVVFVLWPSKRPRPPQPQPGTVVSQAVVPPPSKTEPGSKPASLLQSETASQPAAVPPSEPASVPAAKPETAPAVEDVWEGITIEITFQSETWIQVYTDGNLKVDGLFPAGGTARAQADEKLLIHTGNAGGFTFRLNGRPAKPLGRSGQVLTDIKITPENFQDFLEGPSSGLSAG